VIVDREFLEACSSRQSILCEACCYWKLLLLVVAAASAWKLVEAVPAREETIGLHSAAAAVVVELGSFERRGSVLVVVVVDRAHHRSMRNTEELTVSAQSELESLLRSVKEHQTLERNIVQNIAIYYFVCDC
jgi:hypothetical protein